jgi:hypothetical protein
MVTVAANTHAMTQNRVPGAAAMSSLCSIPMGRHASVGEAREELRSPMMGEWEGALGNWGEWGSGTQYWTQSNW